eukprot:CAMPEP_0196772798 /NCGR_PEP_ID=MMETSP1104-20130614/2426_1 /TAXON_ID=33652 /ORGANISM="Cafeteria sp., Strain Caron Lab Isolate" /LENGTH=324 /DNA_ID=CAMNT_0042142941 /DNA_START=62 /DNA_END=1036 /DNA_ORIENTATION=+
MALRLRKRGKQPRSKRGAPRGGGDEVQRELDARAKPSNKVREVVGLYVYPVKSCAGTSVSEAHTCVTGFENDRQWLVINEKGIFLTQRQHPEMALIQPALHPDGGLVLSAPRMDSLRVPLLRETDAGAVRTRVKVWGEEIADTVDQGDEAAQWLSQYLGRAGCRLVHFARAERPVSAKYAHSEEDRVGFADGFPFLVASQESLQDLQSRCSTEMRMNRFRPNIVVRGCAPFEEDTWREVEVGPVRMFGRKRCTRCKIPTTNQETGEQVGLAGEPISVLRSYRGAANNAVCFGMNTTHQWGGFRQTVSVGDKVLVRTVVEGIPPQ